MTDCFHAPALAQTLLAQGAQAPPSPNSAPMLIGMVIIVGVFFFVMSRTQRRERKKTADMLGNLKKNDRVMTIGGVIGTVVSVKDNEVVIKVDESTNTRMTFIKRAIQQVLAGDDQPQ